MLSRSLGCVEETCAVLTEINAMAVKPGEGNRPNVEIKYKICNSVVNPSPSIMASGCGTYPNAAINKTGLDEQSKDPVDPNKSTSFT
jgi:hypothetical protein